MKQNPKLQASALGRESKKMEEKQPNHRKQTSTA
jgi:hypothetical protein